MRRILLLLCASLIQITVALAINDQGYYYRIWDTEVTVSPDNTWHVSERYDVTFTEQRHGIYRYIQNEFGANRNVSADGATREIRYLRYRPVITITGADGDHAELIDDDNDCTVVRWGSASQLVTGDRQYGLTYTYQTPDDRVPARDYIFHSLIPADVKTEIQELHFCIKFEKPLPSDIAKRLKIYCGSFGSERQILPQQLVATPTQITGIIRDIPSYNAVTLYAELPEGYYEGTVKATTWPAYLCYALALLFALWLLWRELTDQQPRVTPSVEFYAPESVTPTLVGKIIDGSTDDIDIAALIPWLAQHGYLTIRDIPAERGIFGKKGDVELTKVKDLPDDAPAYQHSIMKLLFCKGDTQLMSKMGDRHTKAEAAKANVDKLFKGEKELSETHHLGKFFCLLLTSTLCILFSSHVSLFNDEHIIAAAIWGISFLAAWCISISLADRRLFSSKWMKVGMPLGRALAFLGVMLMLYVTVFEQGDLVLPMSLYLVLGALCYVVCELSQRTVIDSPYRTEMAGRLLGFREFIDTAEKDRLQQLVDHDPAYFYKVLPYAMIFGLTDKWADMFRDIQTQPVAWYVTDSYNSMNLHRSIANLSTTMTNAIATSAVDHSQSSSGGSFSGGGFSGGGGGGGGAGSW